MGTCSEGYLQSEITVHRAKKRLKEQAATSDMTTERMVAEAMSGLDFECRAKLEGRASCLGKMARSARIAVTDTLPILLPLDTYLILLTSSQLLETIYFVSTRLRDESLNSAVTI